MGSPSRPVRMASSLMLLGILILLTTYDSAMGLSIRAPKAALASAASVLIAFNNGIPDLSTAIASHSTLSEWPQQLALRPASANAAPSSNPEAIDVRRVGQEPLSSPPVRADRPIVTLPDGLTYFDYVVGTGPDVADEGKTVQFQWVLRRSNGYFVDASSNYNDEPFIYKVGNLKKAIKGIDEGIRGMRVGGIRRMNIPPALAFVEGVEDGKPGPLPTGFGPKRQILTRMDREVWAYGSYH
jgi:FKBP-type peptidyl-prolyl cis-trans isomerase FkpA